MRAKKGRHGNQTGLASLDGLGADVRVARIYQGRTDESRPDFWVDLRAGWRFGQYPVHQLHELTAEDLLDAARFVQPCDCDGCKATPLPRA